MSTGTQTEVVMPQMGVSVSEGTITKWLKQVGEAIGRDEPLLEISTDKVDTEVPSPAEGVVTQIMVQEGETVEVGTVLATIGPAGAEVAPPPEAPAPAAAPEPEAAPARRAAGHARARSGTCRRDSGAAGTAASRRAGSRLPGRRRQREDLRVARRRAHRLGARDRRVVRARYRYRRARDEEGHPVVHRVRRRCRPAAGARTGSGRRASSTGSAGARSRRGARAGGASAGPGRRASGARCSPCSCPHASTRRAGTRTSGRSGRRRGRARRR